MATRNTPTQDLQKASLRKMWTSEAIHSLIEIVRGHAVLWNHGHELFNKSTYKKVQWRKVTEQLQQEYPDLQLTEEDVQKKFGVLKSTFQRELRKIHNTPSGSGGSVQPKWEYFRTCSYMVGLYNSNPTRSSFEIYSKQDLALVLTVDESTGQEAYMLPDISNIGPPSPDPSTSWDEIGISSSLSPMLSPTTPTPPSRKRRKRIHPVEENGVEMALDKVKSILLRTENSLQEKTEISDDPLIRSTANSVVGFLSVLAQQERKVLAVKILKVLQEHTLSVDSLVEYDIMENCTVFNAAPSRDKTRAAFTIPSKVIKKEKVSDDEIGKSPIKKEKFDNDEMTIKEEHDMDFSGITIKEEKVEEEDFMMQDD